MAAQAWATRYDDFEVDQQTTPNVLKFAINYMVSDSVTGKGEVGKAVVSFALTDTTLQRAQKIRAAIIADIRDHLTRPDLVPASSNVEIFNYV